MAFFSMKLFCIYGSHFAMPDTTRGRCQGLSVTLSGRNFRSRLQAIKKTCCFSSFWARSGRGEKSDPCTYGTFFKASQRGCLALKRMSCHPIQERHMDGGVGGENRQCKATVRDERVLCVNERQVRRDGTNSSWFDI